MSRWFGVLTALLLVPSLCAAQAQPTNVWQRTFGGNQFDSAQFVQQTHDGGYFVVGVTRSFGFGRDDFYVLKLDQSGKKLWEKTYGGMYEDYPVSGQQTSDGGFIVVGMTSSFGAGGWDAYIVKLDANGNKLWEKTFGGKFDDGAVSIQQTSDAGYIVAGYTQSFGAGGQDFYVLRLDSNGNVVWERTYGGNDSDRAYFIVQTQDGYLLVGWTKSFGSGGMDALVLKIDANGNKLWEKTFGGTNDDLIGQIVFTHDGGYVLVGWTKSFGTGGSDVYIVKLDRDGSRQWERTYGGDRDDQAWSVQQTNDGGYIVAGWTKSFGTSMDGYVLKLDMNGNKVWEKTFGGNKDDLFYSVEQTKDGGYVFAGWTQSFGAGQTDVYIIKTDAEGNTGPYPK
ncbi:hypothetical protein [Pseudothermotoga sp.]